MMRLALPSADRHAHRRGTAAVATVGLLLVLNVIVVGLVTSGGRDQDLTVRRLETIQAFYAAEAGVNMGVRELMTNTDEDGDGVIGGVSSDADPTTDPMIGSARVSVDVTTLTSPTRFVLRSSGVDGIATRVAEANVYD